MRLLLFLSVLALSACSSKPEKQPPARMRSATMGELSDPDAPMADPLATVKPSGAPASADRHTVVMVVLGSARADHVGLCGGRARTPFLVTLRDAHAAAASCAAFASSPWDASAITDLLSGNASAVADKPGQAIPVALRAQGYATVLVNTRGSAETDAWTTTFDVVHSAATPRAWKYPTLAPALADALGAIRAERPLFLTVVLSDAEDPWPPVPRQRWGRNQDWMSLTRGDGSLDPRVVGLRNAELPLDVEDRYLRQLAAAYDHGLELADANTRAVIAALAAAGRDLADMRLVVVGDHGTALGERGLIGNAPVTFETAMRVPLVALDTAAPTAPVPARLSTLAVRDWLLTGAWPEDQAPVAIARANRDGTGRVTMVSTWSTATDKLSWRDGKWEAFDLAADRDELSPTPPAPTDPRLTSLAALLPTDRAAADAP